MKKEIKIIGAVVIALIILGIIYLISKQGSSNKQDVVGNKVNITQDMLASQTPEAAKETQNLINEVVDQGDNATKTISVSIPSADGSASTTVKNIKVVTISPGTNPIDVASGKVITETGKVVSNSAKASSPEAPQESFPMKASDAPKSAIKLQVTSSSFAPNTFTVNRGQVVSLVVSNINETTFSEVFRFDDPSLNGVVLGIAKGETKSISFNAPTKAGEYVFYSSMFDHRAQGAVGKMIVK